MKKKSIYKKGTWDNLRSALIPVLFTLVVIVMIVYGLSQTEASGKAEGLRILEDGIRRAVVINYAIEGRYPESLDYIVQRYKIHVDDTKYAVHYRIFASNIMPDITVIEL